MNFLAKMIQRGGDFRNIVSKALAEEKRKRLAVMEEILFNVKAEAKLTEEIRQAKAKFKKDTSGSSKALLYSSISLTSDFSSFWTSVVGIVGCSHFSDLYADLRSIVIVFFLAFTSISLYLINNQRSYLQERYFKDSKNLDIIHVVMLIISIGGNYQFFMGIMKPNDWFDFFFVIVCSCVLDALSYLFGTLGSNVKYANESYAGSFSSKKSVLSMFMFTTFIDIYVKLRRKYDDKLNEYSEYFLDVNTSETQTKRVSKNSDVIMPINPVNNREMFNINSDVNSGKTLACDDGITYDKVRLKSDESQTKRIVKIQNKVRRKSDESQTKVRPKSDENSDVTQTKVRRNTNQYDSLKSKVLKLNSGERVQKNNFKLKITDANWRKYRQQLLNEDICYTEKSFTYRK
jgi:hypothetical protein